MTFQEFAPVFATLALQLRCSDADEAMARAYFKVLEPLEIELVMAAALDFGRRVDDNQQSWFPRTGEWRDAAGRAERDRKLKQEAFLRGLPAPLCTSCGDTGWEIGDRGAARCGCQAMRRMELLGRRPWPSLPPAPTTATEFNPMAMVRAAVKGMANA